MVLEKQDSGISLASDGPDRKMSDVEGVDPKEGLKLNTISSGTVLSLCNSETEILEDGIISGYNDKSDMKLTTNNNGSFTGSCELIHRELNQSGDFITGGGSTPIRAGSSDNLCSGHGSVDKEEAKSGSLGDLLNEDQFHVPLHKTVCCALCR